MFEPERDPAIARCLQRLHNIHFYLQWWLDSVRDVASDDIDPMRFARIKSRLERFAQTHRQEIESLQAELRELEYYDDES